VSNLRPASDPLPYQPIRIVDISPVHSPLRRRPAGVRSRRPIRRDALVVLPGRAL